MPARWSRRRRATGDPEAIENLPGNLGRLDRPNDLRAAATTQALQHIQRERSRQKFRPSVILLPGFFVCVVPALGRFRRRRHNLRTPLCRRSQHSIEMNRVVPGARDQGRQFFQQLPRIEHDVRGTVAPRPFHPVGQFPVSPPFQPVVRQRRPRGILAQGFERLPVS